MNCLFILKFYTVISIAIQLMYHNTTALRRWFFFFFGMGGSTLFRVCLPTLSQMIVKSCVTFCADGGDVRDTNGTIYIFFHMCASFENRHHQETLQRFFFYLSCMYKVQESLFCHKHTLPNTPLLFPHPP